MTERGKRIRDAFRAKYGVDHPSQLPSVKEKIRAKREVGAYSEAVAKMRATKLEKYGDANFGNVEKGQQTKLKIYGDANYNNRPKMIETNLHRYGKKVSPEIVASIKLRNAAGEAGFGSTKYKKFLQKLGVDNVSQLADVRDKKSKRNISNTYQTILLGNRLRGEVTPMFSEDEYHGTDYKYKYPFKCNTCGNEFADHLYSGHIPRCLSCYPHNRFTSIGQKEVADFIRSLGFNVIVDDRAILDGLEVDIYVPEKNVGIEFNGVFWHSEISGNKDRKYHVGKTEECRNRGVKLLHIFDQEWNEKKPIIQSILRATFGKTPNRIYARKCEVRTVKNDECQAFLRENHIQGSDRSGVRLGLWYAGNLVAVMTFCKSRYDKSVQYEMSRFCCKLNTRVVGSASKLFSHFVKNYNPASVVSYSDRRLFTGETYPAIGMLFCENTPAAYFYTKNGSIVGTRMTFQKHKLVGILPKFDPRKSEWENMKDNGFDRIWDCGHLKYLWKQPIV